MRALLLYILFGIQIIEYHGAVHRPLPDTKGLRVGLIYANVGYPGLQVLVPQNHRHVYA